MISALFVSTENALPASPILGQWIAENGKTRINIKPCGDKLCSTIIWLKNPRKDANNENPALRGRDLVGVRIANNMKPTGKNKWTGDIYSSKRGKNFRSAVKLSGDVISIKGCLTSAGLFCKKVRFKRFR